MLSSSSRKWNGSEFQVSGYVPLAPRSIGATPPKAVAEVAVCDLGLRYPLVFLNWLLDSLSLSSRGNNVDMNILFTWIICASYEKLC